LIFDDLTALFDGFAFVKPYILGVEFKLKNGSKNESEKREEKEGQIAELGSKWNPKRGPKSDRKSGPRNYAENAPPKGAEES